MRICVERLIIVQRQDGDRRAFREFGVNLDSGNVDDADVYPQLQKIVPYAVNVQLKVDTGPVKQKVPTDVPRFVKMLKDAGYRGYVVLEYEAAPDPYEAIPGHLAQLRDAIAKA